MSSESPWISLCCFAVSTMEFEGTGGAETMLDSADDANDAGRRTAAPNLAARPSKDAWRPSSTLQSTAHVGVLRMMENFDNLPLNLSSKDGRLGVLIFATVLSKSGRDFRLSLRIISRVCCRVCLSLSLPPPSPPRP